MISRIRTFLAATAFAVILLSLAYGLVSTDLMTVAPQGAAMAMASR